MRVPRLFRAAHLTTVCFLVAALLAQPAMAAPPVFNGNTINGGMPTFNVRFYGAKGDGTTDDTTPIQNAENAAHAQTGGGVVLLPCGNYKTTAPISVSSNVHILGVSPECVTITVAFSGTPPHYYAFTAIGALGTQTTVSSGATSGSTSLTVASDTGFGSYALLEDAGTAAEYEPVQIASKNGTTITLARPLHYTFGANAKIWPMTAVTDASIEGVTITGANGDIFAQYTDRVSARNVYVSSFVNYPALYAQFSMDVDYSRNRLTNGAAQGIEFDESAYVAARDNQIISPGYPGIMVYGYTHDYDVADNQISYPTVFGILVQQNCEQGSVADNTISDVQRSGTSSIDHDGHGIGLYTDIKDTSVTGNSISNTPGVGIWVIQSSGNITVSGNSIRKVRKGDSTILVSGIFIDTSVNGVTVTGNTIADADDAGIISQTSGVNDVIIANNMVYGVNYIAGDSIGDGIYFIGGSNGVISGNVVDQISATAGTIGIYVSNSSYLNIAGNVVRDFDRSVELNNVVGVTNYTTLAYNTLLNNTTNSLLDNSGATSTNLYVGNMGWNPRGDVVPTVPGSGTAQVNNYGTPADVYVSGGTVTNIQRKDLYGNTVSVASSTSAPVTVHLEPGESIILTYSVAPSWAWFLH